VRRHLLPTLALLLGCCIPTQVDAGGGVRWEPWVGAAFDETPISGEIGRIQVPARHAAPDGPALELAFVRYRTTHPDPGPPIFFLAGGPGGSGIEGAAVLATHPQIRLLEHADVIGVDQRGTGLSRPDLSEPEIVEDLPLDRAVDRADLVAAAARAARRTVAYWKGQGVDLAIYDSAESAGDLDAVRRALGLERIALYGTSYGSHLGLAYLRRHGEHVARAVLTKVEGPDHTWKLPSTVQRHLEQVQASTATDPALDATDRDLLGRLRRLLEQLAASPVTVPADDVGPAVTVGPLDLQVAVARALASAREIEGLPGLLRQFDQGDWSGLAPTARELRHVSTHPMPLMMDCASGATASRRHRIEREAHDPANLLSDAIFAPFYPAICRAAAAPDLGDPFRGPLETPVPTLFVSGTLDVRTPPENVGALIDGFPNGIHVVVHNAGHPARELMAREYRDLLQAFLRGEPVESCEIRLPEPIFGR
jgi:pimeloyl-ACP methyl ester carboxylesterase